MTLPAWRPLKDAPRDKAIVVRCKGMRFLSPANDGDRCSHEGAEYAPIADTLELDRAVQKAIAEAFGELLGHLRIASAAKPLADISPLCAIHRVEGLKRFASILHTSMGGRIPDEVP